MYITSLRRSGLIRFADKAFLIVPFYSAMRKGTHTLAYCTRKYSVAV